MRCRRHNWFYEGNIAIHNIIINCKQIVCFYCEEAIGIVGSSLGMQLWISLVMSIFRPPCHRVPRLSETGRDKRMARDRLGQGRARRPSLQSFLLAFPIFCTFFLAPWIQYLRAWYTLQQTSGCSFLGTEGDCFARVFPIDFSSVVRDQFRHRPAVRLVFETSNRHNTGLCRSNMI